MNNHRSNWNLILFIRFFGFTKCADACPVIMQTIMYSLEDLPENLEKPRTILISFDPETDTPEQLKSYVENDFYPDDMVGLTGSEDAIAKAAEEFMAKYSSSDIGMNLNIGHLNLAAKAFQFEREDFVDLIKDYIVAMELSHNDGVEDQHLPLQPDGWYWSLIHDPRFENTYKILEFRNTPISEILKN